MLLINVILPIFLLIIIGWLLAHFKFVPREISQSLTSYLFWAAGPAIIFSAISSYHISQMLVWRFWFAYLVEIFFVTLSVYFLFRNIFYESKMMAVTSAFSTTFKNTVIVGFPVLMAIVGKIAAIPMAITVIIFNCIVAPILMFLFEINITSDKQKDTRKLFLSASVDTFKNPFVLAAFLGMLFSAFHIDLPLFLKISFNYLAASFVPCALFAVGVELKSFKLEGNLLKSFIIVMACLFLCPIVAVGLSYALNLSPFYSVALVIFSAVPTAKTMYVYVSKHRVFEREVAAIISLTTICSIVTIPFFIYLSYWLWPSIFKYIIL